MKKSKMIDIDYKRFCKCGPTHLNCMEPKDWVVSQLGVWRFNYEVRDVRDKKKHPATFPISLSKKIIEVFSHEGELVLDPFVGSGTTLVAANDLNRNAVGFDLKEEYTNLSNNRVQDLKTSKESKQIAICDDAININQYLEKESISLIWTSPPYSNLLNRKRKNKSRRNRLNDQFDQVEQYSQEPRDLGTMPIEKFTTEIGDIFESLLPLMKEKSHCIINVPDMWWENERITIHISIVEELRKRGFELRNTIIWDRTNIVNGLGIFGYPSNFITMGVTFEYLLDFWKPPKLK